MNMSEALKIAAAATQIEQIDEAVKKLRVSAIAQPVVTWQVEGIMFRGQLALQLIDAVRQVLRGNRELMVAELAALGVKEDEE